MIKAVVLLTALVVRAFAADASLDALLKSLESRYNRAQTLQVQFVETFTGVGQPRRSEAGTLYLKKPGRMRWDYTSPQGKLFLSDGKQVYLYVPSTRRVEKMKLRESEDMRAPLAFLLGKLNFQKEFRNIQEHLQGTDRLITADPKSADLPYSKVEFLVSPEMQIRQLKVTGQDQSILEFVFSHERVNPSFDSKLFNFRMPPGAELVEPS